MDDSCCPQESKDFEAEAEWCEAASCDPTLESCCQRDLEQAAVEARLKAQLSLHDRSKERLRVAARVLAAAPPAVAAAHTDSDLESDEDDEVVGRLRAARLQELQLAAQRKAALQAAGHGRVAELTEGRLLRDAERCNVPLVCHLALTGSPLDDELDEHLARLAHQFLGTRFVRTPISLQCTLHLRLRTPPGPGLLCFREGSLVGAAGLDRFGAPECILEEAVDRWLRQLDMLSLQPGTTGSSRATTARGQPADGGGGSSGEEQEEVEGEEGDEWQQPCEVCGRRYPHQHIRSVYAGGAGRGSSSDESEPE